MAFFSVFGWGLITYTCLSCCEVCDDFPRRVITSELSFTNVSMLHHHSEKLDADFWSVAGEEPGMDLLKFVGSPKSISQGIRTHYHGGMERWPEELLF